MEFLRSPLGAITAFLLLIVTVLFGTAAVQVDRATRPPRHQAAGIDFESVMLRVEEVEFESTDGIRLSGWFFPGPPDRPPVILAHDVGSSRASLLHLAVALRKSGFSVLSFDFRGHGESGNGRSTLGVLEKRDLLGAIDYLAGLDSVEANGLGVYGVGMGAHAAVLAARERPSVRVLVLDTLYPDAGYPLIRRVYGNWQLAGDYLGFVPRSVFTLLSRTRIGSARAEDELANLLGRDVLLVAPEGDPELAELMKGMVRRIPDQPDVDGNLIVLPSTQRGGLYGQDLGSYQTEITDFFNHRLAGQIPDALIPPDTATLSTPATD